MRRRGRGLRALAALAIAVALAAFACNTAELQQPSGQHPAPSATSSTDDAADGDGDEPSDGDPPDADGVPHTLPVTSNVTVQVEPSDNGAAVLAAVKGAKKSVHMTMYLLTNFDMQNALIGLKKAGKDVKVVLNKTFPPNGGDNSQAFSKLDKAGVSVVWAPGAYAFTHAKTIIIDGEKVLIMTMNLTAKADNREFIATDSDPADVADAETIFAADFGGKTATLNGKLVVSPKDTQAVDPRTRLVELIAHAKTSLDVEVQSLSDSGIVDAIIAAKARGVPARVVMTAPGDTDESPAQADAVAKLKAGEVSVVGLSDPYIHAKAIVVDGAIAFVGSQNFTANALFNNREIGVVFDAATEVAKVAQIIDTDFKSGAPR